MIPIFKSLNDISTGHTVFEKDQVLTHEQLNSLADYADDQIRLTRVQLLGTGIACGLHVSVVDGALVVSKGMGVTTDGDILGLQSDMAFTRFRYMDTSFPAYPPFYLNADPNDEKQDVIELLPEDTEEENTQPLGDFASWMGRPLESMIVVLFAESYQKDDDICSGTDCDNLGRELIIRQRVVMVPEELIDQLLENLPLVGDEFRGIRELVADRPIITSAVNSPTAIASLYRTACTSIHTKLVTELSRIYQVCNRALGDVFASDPTGTWLARLQGLQTTFATSDGSIQYYYDFLKDLVETCNAFRELLFGDTTQCVQDFTAFPKHLLLGYAATGVSTDGVRTGFYPSPFTVRTAEEREHAVFLARKIDMMIGNFTVNISAPSGGAPEIRITPSSHEDVMLEERAIPFYYPATTSNRLFEYWSFRLTQRRAANRNYSYHAPAYSAQGGAADPFRSQIGRFDFFRIEGHLGKPVNDALGTITNIIKRNNLPIAVRAIMAGTNRAQVTVKPAIRYNDLHRLHYVIRQDLANQMEEVKTFSTAFNAKVHAEPSTAVTSAEDCDCPSIRLLSANTTAEVNAKASTVKAKLDRSYVAYAADTSWQEALKNTMESAGQLKANLGAVVRNDFSTPYDTLISSSQATWLPWLDNVIKQKEEKEDEKLLLGTFIDRNPGVEHFAGVSRGGTFLLVYDASNVVVADFMLPYYIPQDDTEPAEEPALVRPSIKPAFVVDSGIKVQPSRNTFFNTKLDTAATQVTASVVGVLDSKFLQQDLKIDGKLMQQSLNVDKKIQEQDLRVNFQGEYVNLFRDSINMLGSTVPRADQLRAAEPQPETPSISDEYLAMRVDENSLFAGKIALLQQLASDLTLDEATRRQYMKEAMETEFELAGSVVVIMQYIASMGISVLGDGDGARAVAAISRNVLRLSNEEAKAELRSGLEQVIASTDDKNIHTACANLMNAV